LDNISKLNEREEHWGKLLKPEYNIAPLGGSMRGYKHTDEAKENMSKSHIGKKQHSEIEKWRRYEKMKNNIYAKGQKQTLEHIESRAKVLRGKPKSEDHKAKIGEGNKGKFVSAETKAKQSLAAKNRAPISEETRKKLSDAAIRQWNNA